MNQLLLLSFLFVFSSSSKAATEYYSLAYRNDPATSVVIGWSGDLGTVHYGLVDQGTNYTAYTNSHGIDRTGGAHGITRHFSRLTGLAPNSIYYFVIYDQSGQTSQRFYFRTLSNDSNDPVSFISGGDTRDGFSLFGIYTENCPSGNCLEKRRDGNKLVAKIRPDFIAFTGDYVMNQITSNTTAEWSTWLNDWQLTITPDGRIFPVAFSRGNHEDIFDVHEMFDIPFDEYYTLNIHNDLIKMYMLNTELDACTDAAQLSWLTNDLQSNTGSPSDPYWKFATYHSPTLAIGKDGTLEVDQMNCWIPLFQQNKVRLVMESDSHTTKWTLPAVRNAAGDDFEIAAQPEDGVIYIGEGQWGAPHRDVYYTGSSAKPYVKDAGTFDNFFFIEVNRDTTLIRCVKFENVNSVLDIQNDELGTGLPSNAVLWNPSNGDNIIITNPTASIAIKENQKLATSVYPTNTKSTFTVEFGQTVSNAAVEIYNSLGKLCQKHNVSNSAKQTIVLDENCSGVSYVYIKFEDGLVESHRIIIGN